MASSRSAGPRMQKRLQIGISGRVDRTLAVQELCADTAGLDNERTMPYHIIRSICRPHSGSSPSRAKLSVRGCAPVGHDPARIVPAQLLFRMSSWT
jgi:hypothetical protein